VLLGVRAGVGTSTLAAHLSVLAQQTRALAQGEAVQQDGLLMELAQPSGDLALYLNLDSRFHYEDALRNASRIDATLARTAMARHDSGLVLLDRASGSDAVPPSDPGALLQRLRGVFASVLCDAGGCPLRQLPPLLLDQADEIWLVTDASIATLVSLDQALKHLAGQREREKRLQLVINRHDDSSGMSPEQIARRFEVPLLATLPERPRVRLAASQGHLLLQDAPRDPTCVPSPRSCRAWIRPPARSSRMACGKDSPLPWVDRNGRQGNPVPACRCPPGAARQRPGPPAVRADRAVPEGAVGRA
jgi:pilus assembly protein CpaE